MSEQKYSAIGSGLTHFFMGVEQLLLNRPVIYHYFKEPTCCLLRNSRKDMSETVLKSDESSMAERMTS